MIVTYADPPREDYYHEAEKLTNYLGWMGDFGKVEIISEGNLDSRDDAAKMPALLTRIENRGKDLFS